MESLLISLTFYLLISSSEFISAAKKYYTKKEADVFLHASGTCGDNPLLRLLNKVSLI